MESSLFVFFSTLFAYNFQRLARHKETIFNYDSERVVWIKSNRILIIIISSIGLLGALSFSFLIEFYQLMFIAIPGVVSIFYALGKWSLRNVPGTKIVWIGLVWAFSIGMVLFRQLPTSLLIFYMLGVFLYIISLCIPFDIRDMKVDDKNKKTIPQLLGKKKSIVLSTVLMLASHLIFFSLTRNWILSLSLISGLVLLILSLKDRKELFYSGLIDGHIIFHSLIIILWQ